MTTWNWLLAHLSLLSGDTLVTCYEQRFVPELVADRRYRPVRIGDGAETAEVKEVLKGGDGRIPVLVQFLGVSSDPPNELGIARLLADLPVGVGVVKVVAHTLFFIDPDQREGVLEKFSQLPGSDDESQTWEIGPGVRVARLLPNRLVCIARIARVPYAG